MRTYEHILVESTPPVTIVTLNRPERRKALSLELMHELIDCLREIGDSDQTRAVILAAVGPAF
jgi:enoyl-CoA hydratase/carnithine racemase